MRDAVRLHDVANANVAENAGRLAPSRLHDVGNANVSENAGRLAFLGFFSTRPSCRKAAFGSADSLPALLAM